MIDDYENQCYIKMEIIIIFIFYLKLWKIIKSNYKPIKRERLIYVWS